MIAKHAVLFKAMKQYVVGDRMDKAISDLVIIIQELPGSEEAKKAAAAIEVLRQGLQPVLPQDGTDPFDPEPIRLTPPQATPKGNAVPTGTLPMY